MAVHLVIGSTGFVGGHLIRALRCSRPGEDVFGASDDACGDADETEHFACDMSDEEQVSEVLERTRPDVVFHLAAVSSPSFAEKHPALTYRVNLMGTVHLLEAARRLGRPVTVLVTGTSEIYRFSAAGPVSETHETGPKGHYSLSKYFAEQVALRYSSSAGLRVVCTRSFNHSGPGQQTGFVIPDFASQVAAAFLGRTDEIRVGNLDVVRDFLDVRDVVRAYLLLAQKGENGGIYNVCSGRGVELSVVLDKLIEKAGVRVTVTQQRGMKRRGDPSFRVGSSEKLRALGWRPRVSLEDMLADTLEYWAGRLAGAGEIGRG